MIVQKKQVAIRGLLDGSIEEIEDYLAEEMAKKLGEKLREAMDRDYYEALYGNGTNTVAVHFKGGT